MLACTAQWSNIPMGNTPDGAILCFSKNRKGYKESYVSERELCFQGTRYAVAALFYQGELAAKCNLKTQLPPEKAAAFCLLFFGV